VLGQIVIDQIRTLGKTRLLKKLGRVSAATQDRVLASLAEIFAK
jgi:mRNA interferase MazF